MAWSLLQSRRKNPRPARRRFVPGCETLEDRTVPSAVNLSADLGAALANRTALNNLVQHNQQATSQAVLLATNDVVIEQHILQDVTQLLSQSSTNLNKQLTSLKQQEQQLLNQDNSAIQTFSQAYFSSLATGNTAAAQAFLNGISQFQIQEAAIASYFTTQMNGVQASATATQQHLQLVKAQATNALATDQHIAQVLGNGGSSAGTGSTSNPTLITLNVNPLDINLLGLEVQTSQITVTVSAQSGAGQLLGNLLTDVAGLLNLQGVNNALNTVLGSVTTLLNSASLSVSGVTSGSLSTAAVATTPVLDVFVAPVHLNLLGALVDTSPIHLTITAHSGPGLVLGNVVADLANLFNPPLPDHLTLKDINTKLQQLLSQLNAQIPGIPSAAAAPATTATGTQQVLSLAVPPINLNLLGLILKTTQIQVNVNAISGNGDLLGNVLTTLLNTLHATPQDLSTLNSNLNALLAKVVGVLNASSLVLPTNALASLSQVLQTLALPNLINSTGTATAPILNLAIASTDGTSPPVNVNLLGLQVTTSNIQAQLLAQTGDGQILGNLLYNVANLLNPGGSLNLLTILNQLGL